MRIVIQRVKSASVTVNGQEVASIGTGMVALVGFGQEDGPELPGTPLWTKILEKLTGLRIFPDKKGKTNLSLEEVNGEILLVSQFTLYADIRKGRRPGFQEAADPDDAKKLFERLVLDLKERFPKVKTGVFGTDMEVSLTNWGPVTLVLDSTSL
ncbi:MAG: D-aminoacyl-tRNA deacylase [Desulfovibrionales bacterium]